MNDSKSENGGSGAVLSTSPSKALLDADVAIGLKLRMMDEGVSWGELRGGVT